VNHLMKVIESIKDTDSFDTVKIRLSQAYMADCMQEVVDWLEAGK
jgi:hypothetical protein